MLTCLLSVAEAERFNEPAFLTRSPLRRGAAGRICRIRGAAHIGDEAPGPFGPPPARVDERPGLRRGAGDDGDAGAFALWHCAHGASVRPAGRSCRSRNGWRTTNVIDDCQTCFVIERFEALPAACYRDFGNACAEVRAEPDFEGRAAVSGGRVTTRGACA